MKAIRIAEPGIIDLVDIPVPVPGKDEVRIALAYVGYCGSDLSSFKGVNPLVGYPRVPGHEISGTIESVGNDVPDEFTIGRQVTVLPYFACGECIACRTDVPNACLNNQTMGVQREGSLAQLACVPHHHVIPVDGLTPIEVALIEPLAISFHAAQRAAIRPGEWVAILGVGMIGLGILLAAKAAGARIVAVDIAEAKLALARELGAQASVNSGAEDSLRQVADLTCGDGPTVVFEAAGQPWTYRAAVDMAAQTARVICVGYSNVAVSYETRAFVTKEMTIAGSRGATLADFAAVIEFLRRNRHIAGLLVSRIVPLAGAGQAMRDWRDDPASVTKIVVELASPVRRTAS